MCIKPKWLAIISVPRYTLVLDVVGDGLTGFYVQRSHTFQQNPSITSYNR